HLANILSADRYCFNVASDKRSWSRKSSINILFSLSTSFSQKSSDTSSIFFCVMFFTYLLRVIVLTCPFKSNRNPFVLHFQILFHHLAEVVEAFVACEPWYDTQPL